MGELTARLEAAIPGLKVEEWGGAVPVQAGGRTPDGDDFYFRFRHDTAALYVYPHGGDYFSGTQLYAEGTTDTDPMKGIFASDDEAFAVFTRLWSNLSPIVGMGQTTIGRMSAVVQEIVEQMEREQP